MLALRVAFQNQETQIQDSDVVTLLNEWKSTNSLELRSWYLLQIQAGITNNILDVNMLLSISIDNVREWSDLIVVGFLLRMGANPNLYILSNLGPAHVIVYSVIQGRKNKISNELIIGLCSMFVIYGEKLGLNVLESPSYNKYQDTKNNIVFDKNLVSQVNTVLNPNTRIEAKKYKPTRSVNKWLVDNAIISLFDYRTVLVSLGNPVPAIIGTCLDNIEIAYLVPTEIPSFEFIVTCRAVNLIPNYPMDDNGEHLHIRHGEVIGMVQAIDGGFLEAFMLFLNSGIHCSYFIMNRLCLSISEAITNNDPLLTNILVEMLISAIKIGTSLDIDQFNLIKNVDDTLASSIEEVYSEPLWKKICSAPPTVPLPNSIRQLVFNLGLDPDDNRDNICSELSKMAMADPETLKTNAIQRQRQRIYNTVSTIAGNRSSTNFEGCTNGQNRQIKPEEYNDNNMIFYRDGDNIFCYTSDVFEDILATKRDPTTKKKLDKAITNQLASQLEKIRDVGLDPSRPISITESLSRLDEKDTINSNQTDFEIQSIKQILKNQNLTFYEVGTFDVKELNRILASIGMEQEILPKLSPKHQLDTFYVAVYYAFQINPKLSETFLLSYKIKTRNPNLRQTTVLTPVITTREDVELEEEEYEYKRLQTPKVKKQVVLVQEVGVPIRKSTEFIKPIEQEEIIIPSRQVVAPQQIEYVPVQTQKQIEYVPVQTQKQVEYVQVPQQVQYTQAPQQATSSKTKTGLNIRPLKFNVTNQGVQFSGPSADFGTGQYASPQVVQPQQVQVVPASQQVQYVAVSPQKQAVSTSQNVQLVPVQSQNVQPQTVQLVPVQSSKQTVQPQTVQLLPVQPPKQTIQPQTVQLVPIQPPKQTVVVQSQPKVVIPASQVKEEQQAAIIAQQQAIQRQQQQQIAFQQQELAQKQAIATKQAIIEKEKQDIQRQQVEIYKQQQLLTQQQALSASQREQAVIAQQQALINQNSQNIARQKSIINSQQASLSQPVKVSVRETQITSPPPPQRTVVVTSPPPQRTVIVTPPVVETPVNVSYTEYLPTQTGRTVTYPATVSTKGSDYDYY